MLTLNYAEVKHFQNLHGKKFRKPCIDITRNTHLAIPHHCYWRVGSKTPLERISPHGPKIILLCTYDNTNLHQPPVLFFFSFCSFSFSQNFFPSSVVGLQPSHPFATVRCSLFVFCAFPCGPPALCSLSLQTEKF